MLNLNCLSCGFLIEVDEYAESCECEACSNTWQVAQLTAYRKKVQDVLEQVTEDFRKIEQQAEEARKRKQAEEDRKKADESYIARRQADAELERAKNEGKPKTVIINGPDVQGILDNAVAAFAAKDFASAVNGANEVLSSDAKNLPAGFIIAFNEQVFKKRMHQIDQFFANVPALPGAISAEDLDKLCQLFMVGRLKLADYEAQILNLLYTNGQEMGPAAVCKFVDGFSPNIIAARSNAAFLSGDLLDAYMKLSAFCSIPRTCFALLGAIESNPDSPLKNGAYYLTGKNKKFFDEFVTPVGEIVNKMRSEKNRPQFQQAFADKSRVYRQKAKI